MEVVNIRIAELRKQGFRDFENWARHPNHLYIGRDRNHYVSGTRKSKWHNPFSVDKYGLDECLALYENYIRKSHLYNDLHELENKILGCWCAPEKCHGDILIKLLREKKNKEIEEECARTQARVKALNLPLKPCE
jgi:hypothetical protein